MITRRGITADLVTNCHPFHTPIYAFTNVSQTRCNLMLNRAVYAFRINFSTNPEKTIQTALQILKTKENFQSGDKVVAISDVLASTPVDAIQIRILP